MLCDLGGGTADIACHEVDDGDRIRQIVAPSGGAWGSAFVDDHFVRLLGEVFGAEWMGQFEREHPTKFVELLRNFRNSKRSYDGRYVGGHGKGKRVRRKQFDCTFHNVQLPFEFMEFMAERLGEEAEDGDGDGDDEEEEDLDRTVAAFTKFGKEGLLRLNDEYLEMSFTIWNSLFDPLLDEIVKHCQMLLDSPAMRGCKYLCLGLYVCVLSGHADNLAVV